MFFSRFRLQVFGLSSAALQPGLGLGVCLVPPLDRALLDEVHPKAHGVPLVLHADAQARPLREILRRKTKTREA